jgi:acylphosphatase
MSVAALIRVTGLVQGVGFRFFVYRVATRLGLVGYVENAYDGSVEIEVEGDRSLIEELVREVRIGPRSARVANLSVEWREFKGQFTNFDVR